MGKKYAYSYSRTCENCKKSFNSHRYAAKSCSSECASSLISKKKKIYTDEQIEKAIYLKKTGIANKSISEITGVRSSSLDRIFKEKGIKLEDDQRAKLLKNRWKNHAPIVDGKKRCSGCKAKKDLDCFSKNSNAHSGLSPRCRECQGLDYLKKSEKVKASVKTYRDKNKVSVAKNSNEYYLKNKEKILERSKRWAGENPERRKKIEQFYSSSNQGEKNARASLYRARKREATPPWIGPDQISEMSLFFKNCPAGHHVDHIVPVGGDDVCGLHVPWNLQYLPRFINESKSNIFSDVETKVGPCHQYLRREATIAEDLSCGLPQNPPLAEFEMSLEMFTEEHHSFIKRYEWLGTKGFNSKWTFVARYKGIMGGIVVISEPNSYSKHKDVEAQIQRGASAAWTPKNLASKLISFACDWMAKNTAKRILFGYSDFEAGEVGTIYQACNFEYMGSFFGAKTMYETPDGKVISSKNFTRTSAMKKWAKELGIEWQPSWTKENGFQNKSAIPKDILKALTKHGNAKKLECKIIKVLPKGKYAKLLYTDKRDKEKVQKYRFWHPLPYPKRLVI